MKDLGHGANVDNMAEQFGKDKKDIIDFSSNVNPHIISDLGKYVLEGLEKSRSYPDINYTNLRNNISNYINIDSEYIIPGNGATEIIYLLMKSIKKRIAILNPTFSEYGRGAKLNNLEVINFHLKEEDNFSIDLDEIQKNIDKFDSLFVCNPNNPNGKVKDLNELLDLMIENNKLLIVDETFMEFVGNEEKYTLINRVEETPNLFILKAVTKFFGMPGLRLGYGVTTNEQIIKNIYEYKEPWTINSFAENLSNYLFKDKEYIRNSKDYYINERKFMLEELRKIPQLKVYDTDTNFVLMKLKDREANLLKLELFEKYNILIRDASNFIGLYKNYVRVAIKGHEDNKILIESLKRYWDNIMKFYGVCPASCGEFVQGILDNEEYLSSYAINLFSVATLEESNDIIYKGPRKSRRAMELVFEKFNIPVEDTKNISLNINSQIPVGKGMASSTADIGATIKATLSMLNKTLTGEEISKLAVKIEATDSLLLNQHSIFNPLTADIKKYLGGINDTKVVILEPNDILNTKLIRTMPNYKMYKMQNKEIIKKSFDLLDEGLAKKDLNLIGRACTYSGLANENIHQKPFLKDIIEVSDKFGCYGVNIAHSGTVVGILMHKEMDDKRIIQYLKENEISQYYKKIYTSDIIDGKVREEEEWNILKIQK